MILPVTHPNSNPSPIPTPTPTPTPNQAPIPEEEDNQAPQSMLEAIAAGFFDALPHLLIVLYGVSPTAYNKVCTPSMHVYVHVLVCVLCTCGTQM